MVDSNCLSTDEQDSEVAVWYLNSLPALPVLWPDNTEADWVMWPGVKISALAHLVVQCRKANAVSIT